MMPLELPKTLPSRHATDHKIELVPGSKPFAKDPYRMSFMELVEMRSSCLSCLMLITLSPPKLLMVVQFCSKRSKMGHCKCVWTIEP